MWFTERTGSVRGCSDDGVQIGDALVVDDSDVEPRHDHVVAAGGKDVPGEVTESACLMDGSGLDEGQPGHLTVLQCLRLGVEGIVADGDALVIGPPDLGRCANTCTGTPTCPRSPRTSSPSSPPNSTTAYEHLQHGCFSFRPSALSVGSAWGRYSNGPALLLNEIQRWPTHRLFQVRPARSFVVDLATLHPRAREAGQPINGVHFATLIGPSLGS